MTKLKILLDCDGVVSNFYDPCLDIIKDLVDEPLELKDPGNWDIFHAHGLSEEVRKATYEVMNRPGWCSSLKPYPGAIDGVQQLMMLGDVYIVTSPTRGDTWHREREIWAYNHLGIYTKRVIHTAAKEMVYGDLLIDDRESNLQAWAKAPWNRYGVPIKWVTHPDQPNHYVGHSYQDWTSLIEFIKERFEDTLIHDEA